MQKIYLLISIILCQLVVAGEHGGVVIDDHLEIRTVLQNGKAFTYASAYRGLCVAIHSQTNDRVVTPGGVFDFLADARTCYVDLMAKIQFTEPCLIDVRASSELPVPNNLNFTCPKEFKNGPSVQVWERQMHKESCGGSYSKIVGFYNEHVDFCKAEAMRNIDYYANQMLLIKAE